MKNYIAYFRVSTTKQKDSGLSLEWQQSTTKQYVDRNKGNLIAEFTEVESATKKGKRIEIYKALAECKANDATLIVAKLDRLSRDIVFIDNLINSGVKFICMDIPGANELTIGLLSVIAQNEAKTISTRIKNALQAKKDRGEPLGSPDNLAKSKAKAIRNSVATRVALADLHNSNITKHICQLHTLGLTFDAIRDNLNNLGLKTSRGNPFQTQQVKLLHQRYCK